MAVSVSADVLESLIGGARTRRAEAFDSEPNLWQRQSSLQSVCYSLDAALLTPVIPPAAGSFTLLPERGPYSARKC